MSEIATYILLLFLPEDSVIDIGSLGAYELPAGFYGYVSDTPGPEGIAARLKHHLTPVTDPRSHIDYFRQLAVVDEIWLASASQSRREAWTDLLASIPGAATFVDGFGADLDDDETYLIYFDVRPSLEDFAIGAKKLYPDDIVLRAYARETKNGANGSGS